VCGKRGLFVLVILAAAAALTTSAGAANRGSAKIDLSTRGGVAVYLASQGIDIHGVVIQRGAHNYAGPSCPGKGWTCTTAKRVLQIASSTSDGNSFVCTGGSSSGPGDCTIFQFASGSAANTAYCTEVTGDVNTDQSCRITQTSSTGANNAYVNQTVDTTVGSTQFAHQYGGIRQSSSTGRNVAQINQNLNQKTRVTDASGLQKQDGHQEAAVSQNSTTGANIVNVDQKLGLQADARNVASVNQLQNTDGHVTSNVGVDQFSTSGRNNATVDQRDLYDASVTRATTANQQQGSPDASGEAVAFDQQSSGVSTIQSSQQERQAFETDTVTNVTQKQYGPQWADPSQGSNPNDTYSLLQHSHQLAPDPDIQQNEQFAECNTSGNCTVAEKLHQQDVRQTNSCSGSSCDVSNFIFGQGGESSPGSCNGSPDPENPDSGTCQTVPAPPPPPPPNGD
jgi:hypothetical protein